MGALSYDLGVHAPCRGDLITALREGALRSGLNRFVRSGWWQSRGCGGHICLQHCDILLDIVVKTSLQNYRRLVNRSGRYLWQIFYHCG